MAQPILWRLFTLNQICQPAADTRGKRKKIQRITKVSKLNPLGTMHVCTEVHCNPFYSCSDVQFGLKWCPNGLTYTLTGNATPSITKNMIASTILITVLTCTLELMRSKENKLLLIFNNVYNFYCNGILTAVLLHFQPKNHYVCFIYYLEHFKQYESSLSSRCLRRLRLCAQKAWGKWPVKTAWLTTLYHCSTAGAHRHANTLSLSLTLFFLSLSLTLLH